MKIEAVRLKNIRSHKDTTVRFNDGFNCMVGGLGAGKSSILYAIDFAFIGESAFGRGYEYLLREDATSGLVTVWFTHEGEKYKIVRGLKRRGKSIIQDQEQLKFYKGEKLIAHSKTDSVAEQLKNEVGIDKTLFREIIWVKQERLNDLLDMTPRERQKKLDTLLGLSEFEEAWAKLQSYEKVYEEKKNVLKKDPDVLRIKELQKEYDDAIESFVKIKSELMKTEAELAEAKIKLEEAEERLRSLEEARARIEEVKEAEARLSEVRMAYSRIEDEVKRRREVIGRLKDERDSLSKKESTYRRILSELGISSELSIVELKEEVEKIRRRISSVEGEISASEASLSEVKDRISRLSEVGVCPLCLQKLSDTYKLDLMRRLREKRSELKDKILRLKTEVEELKNKFRVASQAISNIESLKAKIEGLESRIEEESKYLEEATLKLEELKMEARILEVEVKALIGKVSFDEKEFEEAKFKREKCLEKVHETEKKIVELKAKKSNLENKISQLREKIDKAQMKIEEAEKAEKIFDIIKLFRSAYRAVQPVLRKEIVNTAKSFIQKILDEVRGPSDISFFVDIDEEYTPKIKTEEGFIRDVRHLSGGERTLLAFAYRVGIGRLVSQLKTGRNLGLIILDEPTGSLGREDRSIERLADAISRLKAIEQIIAVSHSEEFASRADYIIRVEKRGEVSRVSVEGLTLPSFNYELSTTT